MGSEIQLCKSIHVWCYGSLDQSLMGDLLNCCSSQCSTVGVTKVVVYAILSVG